ncbi:MAG: hypothetical protein NVS9B4_13810 [Candidatus Acidiferrum sp.]
MGITRTKVMASNIQPGPTERGSGKAQYKEAAANMATKAGQRGSSTRGALSDCFVGMRVDFTPSGAGREAEEGAW